LKTPKAKILHRKRTIEKTFSQQSQEATLQDAGEDADSESEAEFGGNEAEPKRQCLSRT